MTMHQTKFYSYIADLYSRSPSPLLCHLEWDLNIHNERCIFIDHRNTHICASRCAKSTLAGVNLYRALGTATENTPSNISLVKTQTKTPIDYGCLPFNRINIFLGVWQEIDRFYTFQAKLFVII